MLRDVTALIVYLLLDNELFDRNSAQNIFRVLFKSYTPLSLTPYTANRHEKHCVISTVPNLIDSNARERKKNNIKLIAELSASDWVSLLARKVWKVFFFSLSMLLGCFYVAEKKHTHKKYAQCIVERLSLSRSLRPPIFLYRLVNDAIFRCAWNR